MPRLPRAVIPQMPHHVTPRGIRRQETFFSEEDYHIYLELMSEWRHRFGVGVRADCPMPNHEHRMAVAESENSLRQARCKIGGTESKTEDGL
jgi:REP-associated tyrosine transposase